MVTEVAVKLIVQYVTVYERKMCFVFFILT